MLPIRKQRNVMFLFTVWGGATGKARADVTQQVQNIEMSIKTIEWEPRLNNKKFIEFGNVPKYLSLTEKNSSSFPNILYGSLKALSYRYFKSIELNNGLDLVWTYFTNIIRLKLLKEIACASFSKH